MEQRRPQDNIRLLGNEEAFYTACFEKYSKNDPKLITPVHHI